jgi:hypothetical protein
MKNSTVDRMSKRQLEEPSSLFTLTKRECSNRQKDYFIESFTKEGESSDESFGDVHAR